MKNGIKTVLVTGGKVVEVIRGALGRDVLSREEPDRILVSENQYDYVENLLEEHTQEATEFWKWVLYELLNNTVMMRSWIGILAEDIRHELGWQHSDTSEIWKPLVVDGLLQYAVEIFPLDDETGKARGFLIHCQHVLEFLKRWDGPRVDLFTGQRVSGRQHHTNRTDPNGNYWNDPLDGALEVLQEGRSLVNVPAVQEYLENSLDRLEKAKRTSRQITDENRALHARVQNDLRCWNTILNQNLTDAPDMPEGIKQYDPAWRVQELSGRISEIGGGGQNCSAEMKQDMRNIHGVKNMISCRVR